MPKYYDGDKVLHANGKEGWTRKNCRWHYPNSPSTVSDETVTLALKHYATEWKLLQAGFIRHLRSLWI